MNNTNNTSIDYKTASRIESKIYKHLKNTEWEYKNCLVEYSVYEEAKATYALVKSVYDKALINELLA